MFEQECVPFAPSLIESMRSLGYSFSSAVADLIDNSISANCKSIEIISEPSMNPSLILLDDGCGMSKTKLYEAMRYGSSNPLEERAPEDMGRFGLGMKSASLSQCRRMVVVSKQNDSVNSYSWDLDYVIQKKKWVLKGFGIEEVSKFPHIDLLMKKPHGTYIFLSEFDRIKEGTSNISETFNKALDELADHIALVFHRFLEDGLTITINNRAILARDPFLSDHPATQRKKELPIYINEEKILLKPYILPHISKLSQADLDKVGGKERLRNEQGFYVYRNKRLIVWGTWFRLERKEELNKLARIRVDIPNSLDYMWSIDIKKSTAVLPDIIKKNMYAAVYESVLGSESVHTHRGRKENKNKDIDYIWERLKIRDGYEYVINREIPQLKILADTLDDSQLKMLENLVKTLEESFPVSALYVDAAKGKIEEKAEDEDEIDRLWSELQLQIQFVKSSGFSVADYYRAFSRVEPYCNYQEIKERIAKELSHYE